MMARIYFRKIFIAILILHRGAYSQNFLHSLTIPSYHTIQPLPHIVAAIKTRKAGKLREREREKNEKLNDML
jgi:hypothetical protein